MRKTVRREGSLSIFQIIIIAVLFLAEWLVLSLSGTIPKIVSFQPGLKLFYNIFDKEAAIEFIIDDFKYSIGAYKEFINTGTEANLQACDDSDTGKCACSRGGRLYVSGKTFWSVEPDHPGDLKAGSDWGSGSRLFVPADKKHFMRVWYKENANDWVYLFDPSEKGECAYPESQDWLSGCFSTATAESIEFSFNDIAANTLNLLEKQETEELELYQAARLTYFTAKGVILDYDGETAIFADSLTEPGWMTVYSQKPGSDRKELLRVPVSYAGSGAGRFMANGKLYYADESRIYEYDFAGEPRLLVDAEQPIISMNYLFYDHDKLCVGALTKHKLKSIRIDENYAIESILLLESMISDLDKWLFTVEDTFFIFDSDEKGTFSCKKIE